VIDRPKVGFSAPRASWVAPLLAWEPVAVRFAQERGRTLVRTEGVRALFAAARAGAPRAQDAVWRLVNLAIWVEDSGVSCADLAPASSTH
jgi:Asparagine synthase